MSTSSSYAQLTLPSEWDDDNEMMQDEELSATSHEYVSVRRTAVHEDECRAKLLVAGSYFSYW